MLVAAIGIPPQHIIDKIQKHGLLYMQMVGKPGSQVGKALEAGADLICCQCSSAGGHTADVGEILFPLVLRQVGEYNKKNNKNVLCVAAGGIANGNQVASLLAMGFSGVWIGTRFIATPEASTSDAHKQSIVESTLRSTKRTLYLTGRPCRVENSPFLVDYETNRRKEMEELLNRGKVPFHHELDLMTAQGKTNFTEIRPHIYGMAGSLITEIKPAGEVVEELVNDCIESLNKASSLIKSSRL